MSLESAWKFFALLHANKHDLEMGITSLMTCEDKHKEHDEHESGMMWKRLRWGRKKEGWTESGEEKKEDREKEKKNVEEEIEHEDKEKVS